MLVSIKGNKPPIVVAVVVIICLVARATRHIITTTATTIGGLFPLILTSIFFQPLAWAMSVGVIGASLIALFYIPAMFMILGKIPRTT